MFMNFNTSGFVRNCVVFDKEHSVKFPKIVNLKEVLVNVGAPVCPGLTFRNAWTRDQRPCR
jgi:hypothetical protein